MAFRTLPIMLGHSAVSRRRARSCGARSSSTLTETYARRDSATIGALLSPADLWPQAVQKLSADGGYGRSSQPGRATRLQAVSTSALELISAAGQCSNNRDDTNASCPVSIYIGIAICASFGLALVARLRAGAALGDLRADGQGVPSVHNLRRRLGFRGATALFACQYLNAGGAPGFDFTQIPRALGALAIRQYQPDLALCTCAAF